MTNPPESAGGPAPRICIAAGPTHEPVDEVRYLANRSSGTLGLALADEAAGRGWPTTLLLGPTPKSCEHTSVWVHRFTTAEDLRTLLVEHAPLCDVLVMAAAVADYRPIRIPGSRAKMPRQDEAITIRFEPVPDLLAEQAASRKPGQVFVGFALDEEERLADSARRKLREKRIDIIVANPLEAMDAAEITATVYQADEGGARAVWRSEGQMPKSEFAGSLMDLVGEASRRARSGG